MSSSSPNPRSSRGRGKSIVAKEVEAEDDCRIVQVLTPDPAQFDILKPLEELDRKDKKKAAKRKRRKNEKCQRRSRSINSNSQNDTESDLDDLFEMHFVNPKKSRISKSKGHMKTQSIQEAGTNERSTAVEVNPPSDLVIGGHNNPVEAVERSQNQGDNDDDKGISSASTGTRTGYEITSWMNMCCIH